MTAITTVENTSTTTVIDCDVVARRAARHRVTVPTLVGNLPVHIYRSGNLFRVIDVDPLPIGQWGIPGTWNERQSRPLAAVSEPLSLLCLWRQRRGGVTIPGWDSDFGYLHAPTPVVAELLALIIAAANNDTFHAECVADVVTELVEPLRNRGERPGIGAKQRAAVWVYDAVVDAIRAEAARL